MMRLYLLYMVRIFRVSVLMGMMFFSTLNSFAQSGNKLNSESIVNALQNNNGQATRSLVAKQDNTREISPENRQILKELSTRGFKLETVARVGSILDENNLPSLDIEILFEYDSSNISVKSKDALEALGKALRHKSLVNAQILLNGHTDSKGEENYNLTLSQKRADEVRGRLISDYGISQKRLIAIGFGEARLKDSSNPESTTNRRVEVMNIGTQ